MTPRMVVVVGTGTDVGKTHVTAAMVARLRARGVRVAAWKPIASGLDASNGDGGVFARALGEAYDPPVYGFAEPISPHLAAARAGVEIDVAPIREGALARAAGVDVLFVESAGGLFSPISPHATNADLARALAPAALLLVAPDRLGVLHDLTAVRIATNATGMHIDAFALSAPATPDASTGSNAHELDALAICHIDAVFPRASIDAEMTARAADATWQALSGARLRPVLARYASGPERSRGDYAARSVRSRRQKSERANEDAHACRYFLPD